MGVFTDVRAGIRKGALVALNGYPTMPVIFSHSNGTEPAESYVVINILSIEQQGHNSTSTLTNEDEELSITASYEVLAQFSFCGSLSGDASHSFNQRINNNHLVFEELGRYNLGVLRKSTIRRAPQKRDTQWVEFHNMDVTFSYNVVTQQLVDVIESVIMEDVLTGEIFTIPPDIVIP